MEAQGFVRLATGIANDVMTEACRLIQDASACALLLDIVEVLRPVLVANGDGEGAWQTSYDKALVPNENQYMCLIVVG